MEFNPGACHAHRRTEGNSGGDGYAVAMVDEVKSGMRKVETILVEAPDPGTKKTGKALDLPLDASCGRYWIFLQFYRSLQLSGI
jgi:hypothetical protein